VGAGENCWWRLVVSPNGQLDFEAVCWKKAATKGGCPLRKIELRKKNSGNGCERIMNPFPEKKSCVFAAGDEDGCWKRGTERAESMLLSPLKLDLRSPARCELIGASNFFYITKSKRIHMQVRARFKSDYQILLAYQIKQFARSCTMKHLSLCSDGLAKSNK